MEIVDTVDAINGLQRALDFRKVNMARSGLHEHINRFSH
jgi:hypothetical protein